MVDPKKAAEELGAKAAFAKAKQAAERAIQDALMSDEERAKAEAERAALAKRKRNKTIAFAIVGVLLVLGAIGMVLSYWQWFFLAGLVGLAGLYARHRWRKSRRAKREKAAEEPVAPKQERAPAKLRVKPEPEPRAPAAPVVDESSKETKQAIEDELAALKARVQK
jgi:hypothetical protein